MQGHQQQLLASLLLSRLGTAVLARQLRHRRSTLGGGLVVRAASSLDAAMAAIKALVIDVTSLVAGQLRPALRCIDDDAGFACAGELVQHVALQATVQEAMQPLLLQQQEFGRQQQELGQSLHERLDTMGQALQHLLAGAPQQPHQQPCQQHMLAGAYPQLPLPPYQQQQHYQGEQQQHYQEELRQEYQVEQQHHYQEQQQPIMAGFAPPAPWYLPPPPIVEQRPRHPLDAIRQQDQDDDEDDDLGYKPNDL